MLLFLSGHISSKSRILSQRAKPPSPLKLDTINILSPFHLVFNLASSVLAISSNNALSRGLTKMEWLFMFSTIVSTSCLDLGSGGRPSSQWRREDWLSLKLEFCWLVQEEEEDDALRLIYFSVPS
ncbi:hypothetical protein ACHAXS_007423 [Conticribra weissflogii]